MVEKFGDAALRHLGTAEVLEDEGRIDDAAYHYGLVGETALKAAVESAIAPLPKQLLKHINQRDNNGNDVSLQTSIVNYARSAKLLANGRLGGALLSDLTHTLLNLRFTGWSLNIRYADSDCCPVSDGDLAVWKADAIALFNGGVF